MVVVWCLLYGCRVFTYRFGVSWCLLELFPGDVCLGMIVWSLCLGWTGLLLGGCELEGFSAFGFCG